MKNLKTLLCAALLAAALPAQISSDDILISETPVSGPSQSSQGLYLVDYKTGKARLISGLNGGPYAAVALDHRAPAELWSSSGRPAISSPLDHLVLNGDASKNGPGMTVVDQGLFGTPQRLHVYEGDLLYTLSGGAGGLYRKAKGAKKSTLLQAAPRGDLFYDIAVLGQKIYVSTKPASGSSQLVEVDMSGSSPMVRTLKLVLDPKAPTGAKLPASIECICAHGAPEGMATKLAVADVNGVIYIVDPSAAATTHNVTTDNQPGNGTPRAIAWHPGALLHLVIATKDKVYDRLSYMQPQGKPIYTAATQILDMACSTGHVSAFGKGCGSSGKVPTVAYGGAPFMGNSNFTLSMRNGQPSAAAYLIVGLSKDTWGGSALPRDLGLMGATGCQLLVSMLLITPLTTDAQGDIDLGAALPRDTQLIGFRTFVQFGVADSQANAAGLSVSDAMEICFR
jgi:hypothetical protein